MMPGLDPAQSFGTFVVGAANQLAVSAARALAESAQPPFNPLVLHGGEGLGKTHLLHAIGHLRLEVEPRATVRLVAWADLAEGGRAAVGSGRGREFLDAYLEAGLLLVDDAHRLAGTHDVQAHLLGMLEARVRARRGTVLASRLSPAELGAASDQARRLLDTGLAVELNPPDPALRWEILYRRSAEAGVDLTPPVLEEIAALPFASVRDVVGAVNRLIAFQAVSPGMLQPTQARVLITGVFEEPAPDTGTVAVSPEPARPLAEARGTPEAADEFGSFLSEVVASVSHQVDRWRSRVADAMLRWEGEGYHTARLQALLDQELTTQPDQLLRRFEADVDALRRLQAEAEELAPDLARHEAFSDPDQLETAQRLVEEARVRDLAVDLPQPQYRLEALVEGQANRLALDVARGLAAEPGAGPNPLLVIGDAGVGKTHLLHGIGNALVEAGVRGVVCLPAHGFETGLQEAIDADQLAQWRRRFRWAGALLLDDVHTLAGRPVVQEELSTLLDRMLGAGRQVVFTSAVPVAELSGLAAPLLSRLASGIVVEVPRPDRELRLGVVRRLLSATEAGDDAALADYLAGRPADSVRAIHGLVQRLLRAAQAGGTSLGLALARQVLETPAPRAAPRPLATKPGVFGPSLGGPRLREKLVDDWPHPGDRLVEELR